MLVRESHFTLQNNTVNSEKMSFNSCHRRDREAERMVKQRHDAIDRSLKQSYQAHYRNPTKNVLLLGSSGSGKTSFLKYIQSLGGNYERRETTEMKRQLILNYVVSCGRYCFKKLTKYNRLRDEVKTLFENLDREFVKSVKQQYFTELTIEFLKYLVQNEEDVLQVISFNVRKVENINRFINSEFLSRIDHDPKEWIPSLDEFLSVQHHSVNTIVENRYERDGFSYNFIDTSGQRNERRKWMSQFQHVTDAILYFISLSDFNMIDSITGKNCLETSINIFKELVESNYFKNMNIVLYFTHIDIFKEKIQMFAFSDFFKDYHDRNEEDLILNYIRSLISFQHNTFCHFVNITSSLQMEIIFSATDGLFRYTTMTVL